MKKVALFSILLLASAMLAAQQKAPAIVWQKCLGGSGDDRANKIIRTVDNGFLVVGSSTSNDGDVSGHHGALTSTDAWVVKLSSTGAIEWQKSMGGSAGDEFNGVIITSDGSYLCFGTTGSNDGDVTGNHGFGDIWLVKLSRSGSVLWSRCYGGSANELVGNVRENKNGTLYVIGSTMSNNGDVSGLHSSTQNDIWVLKLSSAGSINWQRCFGGTGRDEGYDIVEYTPGRFIMSCIANSGDGDFGTSVGPTPTGRLFKTDSNKTIFTDNGSASVRGYPVQLNLLPDNRVFVNSILLGCIPHNNNNGIDVSFKSYATGNSSSGLQNITSSTFCNTTGGNSPYGYSTGSSGLVTFNNGNEHILAGATDDSITNTGAHGRIDGYISGINTVNGKTFASLLGGSGNDYLSSTVMLNEFEFVVSGYTGSNNGDVSGNHGGNDCWIVKLGKINFIQGTVFGDYNLNGIKDSNEPLLNNVIVQSKKGASTAASSTVAGAFKNIVDTGSYITSVVAGLPYYAAPPTLTPTVFTNYNTTENLVFAMQPIPGKRDYAIDFFPITPLRPGFNVTYKIFYSNVGTDTLVNRSIKLTKNPRLTFLSAVPVQTNISGDTITWNVPFLAPRDTGTITIQLKAAAPPAINFADTVISTAVIDTAGDLAPSNNIKRLRHIATGAYDPNDKREVSGGAITNKDVADGKALTYTIRFQNTGNDTAFNIVVTDTLDAKTDWASLEMVGASHPFQLTIKDGRFCTWRFENIQLVDSVHNEPLSHGYITYRIKPLSTLMAGDMINNAASIYFDFNPPVKTNTERTLIKLPSFPSPIVSGLLASYCGSMGVQKGKINNLPAGGSGITATVQLDATPLSVAADSTFNINPASISAGVHVVTVVFTNGLDADTLRFNISIDAAAIPDVNVTANLANIINTTDAVTLTAANAAGGGSSPLYTFAKDKAFTNILQAEGSSNQYAVNVASLPMGDNWIYVRMKTSATCYTAQTNIDSIKLYKLLIPDQPTVTGVAATYCSSIATAQKGKISNIPAVEYLATATAKIDGATTLTIAADSTFSFTPSTLAAGNHSVVVTFTNASGTKNATINFAIGAASNPDVNVSANITNVINLTDNVVVTATNASGGGTTPLYTFAKDKAFTNVMQAEGASNTLTIAPNNLLVGANWIYVRMKTSDACYLAQTNIDSIKIDRNSVTGLRDVDNPNQIINVYPNPFKQLININGLSTAKTYTVTINNLNGQQVYSQQISNRSSFSINRTTLPGGSYWITIFDVKKNKIIGTVPLIKE